MVILIDNGHGVDTRGKCSPDRRLLEWSYTREIASLLLKELKREGMDARVLVPEDGDVPLSERCRRVSAVCRTEGVKNVALVSIHVNAAGSDGQWHTARGWEAYTSPGNTSADILAEHLYSAAKAVFSPMGHPIRTDFSDGDSDKEARFKILTGTPCAAVLTENLFQDNREDVEFLLSPSGRQAIVELHRRGILAYLRVTRSSLSSSR